MAVEFLRRCYRSEWFLFRDAPDVATPGRYYFNDDAPAYPGFHLYGSRSWQPESHEMAQGLGERLDVAQPWVEGNAPAWPAKAQAVGSPDCIASGALIDDAIPYGATFDGLIEACVFKQDPDIELWTKVSDYANCNVERMYAFVLLAMTNDDAGTINSVLRAFVGPGPAISFRKSNGIFNGITTVTSNSWQLVLIDGTRNAQQLALQAFYAIAGPQDFGGLSTNPFWFDASTVCMDKMVADGQTADMRIMLVGHSYGGAVACLAAARNRQASGNRKINFLTYGCPKIGDERLVNLLQRCNGLNISNDGDLVTILPPDRYLLAPLIPLFPLVPIFLWANWKRPMPQALLRPDGTLDANAPTPTDSSTLITLITQVVTFQQIEPILQHFLIEYLGRLYNRCPDCCFPCEDEVCEEIIMSNPVLSWTTAAKAQRGLVWESVFLPLPITPGLPPFPGTLPDFFLGILYVYQGGVQPQQTMALKLLDQFAGTYRMTIIATSTMDVNQGIQLRSAIPPTWTLDHAANRSTIGHIDVVCSSDGNALALIFFDIAISHSWNVVFRVDLL
jgi:pimeloyl-ACP methyl ester carboxylesterase